MKKLRGKFVTGRLIFEKIHLKGVLMKRLLFAVIFLCLSLSLFSQGFNPDDISGLISDCIGFLGGSVPSGFVLEDEESGSYMLTGSPVSLAVMVDADKKVSSSWLICRPLSYGEYLRLASFVDSYFTLSSGWRFFRQGRGQYLYFSASVFVFLNMEAYESGTYQAVFVFSKEPPF